MNRVLIGAGIEDRYRRLVNPRGTNLAEAIDLARRMSVPIILCDEHVDDGPVEEIVRQIRRVHPKTCVILISDGAL